MNRLFTFLILICSTYSTTALVQQQEGYPRLLINPGTLSEIKLKPKLADSPKLSAYVDQTISAEVELSEDGTINKISKISRAYTSDLRQNRGTFLKCSN